MRTGLLPVCLAFIFIQASAQLKDTVRSNANYRMGSFTANQSSYSSKGETARYNHYLGLQANQLLQQIFNFSNDGIVSGNPFVFTYSFNLVEKGSGMSFGLGYLSNKIEDLDQGSKRTTKTSDIQFRMGYEKKTSIGKRLIIGYGLDFLLNHGVDETKIDNGGLEFNTKTNGFGFGPRMPILFRVSENVLVGTEMSWYFQRENTDSDFPSVPTSESKLVHRSFNLQMPTAIFLTLKLGGN